MLQRKFNFTLFQEQTIYRILDLFSEEIRVQKKNFFSQNLSLEEGQNFLAYFSVSEKTSNEKFYLLFLDAAKIESPFQLLILGFSPQNCLLVYFEKEFFASYVINQKNIATCSRLELINLLLLAESCGDQLTVWKKTEENFSEFLQVATNFLSNE